MYRCLIHSLLHDTPNLVIHWIQIRTVWGPEIRTNELWCCARQKSHRITSAVRRRSLAGRQRYLQRCDGWLAAGALTATQLPLTLVSGSTNTRPEQPNFDTATDTISDLLKVGRVRNSRSAATSHFLVVAGTYTRSFCKSTGGTTVKIFSSVKNEVHSGCREPTQQFFARVRHDAQFVTVSSCARRFFKHFN